MSLQTPTHLGRYEILDEIGRGAMGVVYLAKDPLIGRLVALKTFRASSALSGRDLELFRARFIREAQSAGILSHPNIVTIHDVVEESEEGVTFIAMEYVRGTNLKEVLRSEGRLGLEEAAHVVGEVSEGLEYAHSRGVVHRDVKPANILLTEDRRVKLTDFGIARLGTSNLTHDGQLLGTPNYMAPEQIRGEAADHRADVFSLGVVLYEMLTGEKPFQGDNVTVVTHRIAYEEFIPPEHHGGPELPEPVERVLDRALAKDPDLRYPSVADMAQALGEAVRQARNQELLNETQEIPDVPPPPPESGGEAQPEAVPGPEPSPDRGPEREPAPVPDRGRSLDAVRSVAAAFGRGVAGGLRRVADGARSLAASTSTRRGAAGGAVKSPAAGGRGRRPVLVVVAVLAILAVAALGWGLVGWIGGEEKAAPEQPDPAAAQRAAVGPLLEQAQEALDAGDPRVAVQLYRTAEKVAPGVEGIADSRRRAEEQLAEVQRRERRAAQVTASLGEARTAVDEKRWDDARSAAQRVLDLDADNADAQTILADVDAAVARLERERAARERQAAAKPPPEPEPAVNEPAEPEADDEAEAAAAAEAPAADQDATLALDFFSIYPEGVLTVYFGDDQLLLEPYRFYKRGKFLRPEAAAGKIQNNYTVPPGAAEIRVIIALPGRPALTRMLQANFPPGTTRRLEIRLEDGPDLKTHLE
jgi:serine/threonine protein kinase